MGWCIYLFSADEIENEELDSFSYRKKSYRPSESLLLFLYMGYCYVLYVCVMVFQHSNIVLKISLVTCLPTVYIGAQFYEATLFTHHTDLTNCTPHVHWTPWFCVSSTCSLNPLLLGWQLLACFVLLLCSHNSINISL